MAPRLLTKSVGRFVDKVFATGCKPCIPSLVEG